MYLVLVVLKNLFAYITAYVFRSQQNARRQDAAEHTYFLSGKAELCCYTCLKRETRMYRNYK